MDMCFNIAFKLAGSGSDVRHEVARNWPQTCCCLPATNVVSLQVPDLASQKHFQVCVQ